MRRYMNTSEAQLRRLEERRRRDMTTALDRLSVSSEVRFYSVNDLVEISGWSRKVVLRLFNDPEFPSLDYGKAKLVEAHALIMFMSVKHERKNEPYWISFERPGGSRRNGK